MAGLGPIGTYGFGQGLLQGLEYVNNQRRQKRQDEQAAEDAALRKQALGLQVEQSQFNLDQARKGAGLRQRALQNQADLTDIQLQQAQDAQTATRRTQGFGSAIAAVQNNDWNNVNAIMLGMHQSGQMPNPLTFMPDEKGGIVAREDTDNGPVMLKWKSKDDLLRGLAGMADPQQAMKNAANPPEQFKFGVSPDGVHGQYSTKTGKFTPITSGASRDGATPAKEKLYRFYKSLFPNESNDQLMNRVNLAAVNPASLRSDALKAATSDPMSYGLSKDEIKKKADEYFQYLMQDMPTYNPASPATQVPAGQPVIAPQAPARQGLQPGQGVMKPMPATNSQGWRLMTDANGNRAYVGPNGQIQEVQ